MNWEAGRLDCFMICIWFSGAACCLINDIQLVDKQSGKETLRMEFSTSRKVKSGADLDLLQDDRAFLVGTKLSSAFGVLIPF